MFRTTLLGYIYSSSPWWASTCIGRFPEELQNYFKCQSGAYFSYQIAKTLEEGENIVKVQLEEEGNSFYTLSEKDKKTLHELFISSQNDWISSMPEEKKTIVKEILTYALERSAFYKFQYEKNRLILYTKIFYKQNILC